MLALTLCMYYVGFITRVTDHSAEKLDLLTS